MAKAQTWDEFFRQKETQKKYLLQQLAALKLYADHLSKGYEIADKGLKTIEGFTKGEFDLHSAFFESLKVVKPAVANNKNIREILTWQAVIIKGYNSLNREAIKSGNDKSYIESVRSKVLSDCARDVEDLLAVISSGELEMKDDERLKRIDKLHSDMRDKYQFTESFIRQIKVLNLQREQEKQNSTVSKKIYGITN
ncbi:hypothetical protein [Pedobacter sp. SYSU D00535]|uniref:hypothetical protein n=1 Tax=Pedobacter sp. SYSU D00535 TaxID=2810308 RepID=UPI001A9643F0|nr:hypothetical protein [Pedobacter sp. SYSU D00535]